MKKIMMTLSLVVGIALSTQAQYLTSKDGRGGGLFGRGSVADEVYYGAGFGQNSLLNDNGLPGVPNGHDLEGDQPAPVGSGVALLIGLGSVYCLVRKRKENQ